MALTVIEVNKATPRDKAYKLSDQKGLYLLVNPSGSKHWKLKYRFAGKEKKLALGSYPEITLAQARDKQLEARQLLMKEVDPGMLKQSRKRSAKEVSKNSFEFIAREWLSVLTEFDGQFYTINDGLTRQLWCG